MIVLCGLLVGCGGETDSPVASDSDSPEVAAPTIAGDESLVLQRSDGREARPLALDRGGVRVFLFTTVDCPIANGYAPEIKRIHEATAEHWSDFFLVHVDPSVNGTTAAKHAAEYDLPGVLLLDPEQRLAASLDASITPQAIVLRNDGGHWTKVYSGRIDDRYVDFGKKRAAPSRHDLEDQIRRASGRGVLSYETTRAIGCPMPEFDH